MITISRTVTVAAPAAAVLAYLKDFGHTSEWDPATQQTTRIGDGPVGVGASWHNSAKVLGVRTELTYTLLVAESDRLVFAGRSEGATSTGTFAVRPVPGGTEVTYAVELEMHGVAKLVTPLMKAEFQKLGTRTAAGLADALNRLPSAAQRSDLPG